MEFNRLEFGFMSRILTAYVIANDRNMLSVDSNGPYALQRLRPIYRAIGWVQHWADKYALVGERYYAIIS